MSNIKLVIFDLDGTLVDSMSYWEKTPAAFLLTHNIIEDRDISQEFLSLSLEESAILYKERYSLSDSKEKIMQDINNIMENNYLHYVELKPGIKELLTMLSKYDIKMAIASATDKYLIIECIDKLGIGSYFTYIITSTEVGSSKSHPDIYLNCTEHFHCSPEETIIFEDLPYGIISSSKVGFHTVGIYDEPSRHLQQKIKENAECYCLSFDEESINKIELYFFK